MNWKLGVRVVGVMGCVGLSVAAGAVMGAVAQRTQTMAAVGDSSPARLERAAGLSATDGAQCQGDERSCLAYRADAEQNAERNSGSWMRASECTATERCAGVYTLYRDVGGGESATRTAFLSILEPPTTERQHIATMDGYWNTEAFNRTFCERLARGYNASGARRGATDRYWCEPGCYRESRGLRKPSTSRAVVSPVL